MKALRLTLEIMGSMAAMLCPDRFGEMRRLERPHSLPSSKNIDGAIPAWLAAHETFLCNRAQHARRGRWRESKLSRGVGDGGSQSCLAAWEMEGVKSVSKL